MRGLALTLLALGVHMDVAPIAVHAQDWSPVPSLSHPRHGAAATALDGRVYVLGGRWADDLATASVFDTAAGAWSDAAPMSQTRYQPGAAALGGFVYALGGYDMIGMTSLNVERLDPATNAWTSRSGMPTARAGMAVGVAGGGIVVAGGMSDEGMLGTDCYRYDPGSDRWSVIGTLAVPRAGLASAVLGERVWAIGGSDGSPSARVDVYDAGSSTWSVGPDLPEPLWLASAVTLGDRVWVMGGLDAALSPSTRVYSAGADGVWRPESDLTAAASSAFLAATSPDCALLGGGLDGTGQPTATVWARCSPTSPPPPPSDTLQVAVTVSPASLNRWSQGQWISARLAPAGWPVADIVVESLRLDGVSPAAGAPVETDLDANQLTVKFPRSPFASRPDGEYTLALTGLRADGLPIAGTAPLSVHGGSVAGGWRRAQPHGLRVVGVAGAPASIQFTLAEPTEVALDVLDLQGRAVSQVARATLPAGDHRQIWPAAGAAVRSGLYLVRLRTPGVQGMVRLSYFR